MSKKDIDIFISKIDKIASEKVKEEKVRNYEISVNYYNLVVKKINNILESLDMFVEFDGLNSNSIQMIINTYADYSDMFLKYMGISRVIRDEMSEFKRIYNSSITAYADKKINESFSYKNNDMISINNHRKFFNDVYNKMANIISSLDFKDNDYKDKVFFLYDLLKMLEIQCYLVSMRGGDSSNLFPRLGEMRYKLALIKKSSERIFDADFVIDHYIQSYNDDIYNSFINSREKADKPKINILGTEKEKYFFGEEKINYANDDINKRLKKMHNKEKVGYNDDQIIRHLSHGVERLLYNGISIKEIDNFLISFNNMYCSDVYYDIELNAFIYKYDVILYTEDAIRTLNIGGNRYISHKEYLKEASQKSEEKVDIFKLIKN